LIESFLKQNNNFETVDLDSKMASLGKTIKRGMLMILPDDRKIKGGLDGFFISVLKKK